MEYIIRNFRIRDVLLMQVAIAAISILYSLVFFRLSHSALLFYNHLCFLIWFLLISKRNGGKIAEIKSLCKTVNWKMSGVIFAVSSCFTLGEICVLVYLIFLFAGGIDDSFVSGFNSITWMDNIYEHLCVCFTGPIVEEVVFRGIVLNRLSKKVGINKAIIISSLLFGVVHGPVKCFDAFIFGIICSLIYLRSNNLMNTIVLHVLHNSFGAILMPTLNGWNFTSDETSETEVNIDESTIFLYLLYIGLVLLLPSTIYLVRFIKNNWRYAVQSSPGHDLHVSGSPSQ